MRFACNFCSEFFSDFLTYERHLKARHKDVKRIQVKEIKLEREQITCVKSCEWLNCHDKHVLYNVDGNRYCEDCKRECIAYLRIKKAYKSYLDQIEDLNDILYPDLWVQVEKDWFECCWCVDTRHGDEEGGTFYEFANHPEHILCDRCFQNLMRKGCHPSGYCSECDLKIPM